MSINFELEKMDEAEIKALNDVFINIREIVESQQKRLGTSISIKNNQAKDTFKIEDDEKNSN